MKAAARKGDPIEHSGAFEGIVAGIIVGVAVGAIVVATGGMGVVAAVALAGSIGSAGQMIGSLFKKKDEVIDSGSPTVQIGKKWAARAKADKVSKHAGQVIAQGSRRTSIDGYPAARLDDKTECGGKIAEGCASVHIGMEPGTYVKIGSEVPWILELAVNLASNADVFHAAYSGLKGLKGAKGLKNLFKSKPKPGKPKPKKPPPKPKSTKKPPKKAAKPTEKPAKKPAKKPPKEKSIPKKGTTPKAAGKTNKPTSTKCTKAGEPVDVASGAVVWSGVDLEIPGLVPIRWERSYSSARAQEAGQLGHGWTHSYERWVELGDNVVLHDGEGREIYFGSVPPGMERFHRQEQLTLARFDDVVTVREVATGLTQIFRGFGSRLSLSEIRDSWGNGLAFFYEGEELARVLDSAGREIRITSDENGRAIRLEVWARSELRQWVDYSYHPEGDLAEVTDAAGNSYLYDYDEQHRLSQTTFPNGTRFYYTYDDRLGRCVKTCGDDGLHTAILDFDVVEGSTRVTGGEQPVVHFWNADGLVTRTETLDGECLLVREYDDDQYLVAEGPCISRMTFYDYDERGHLVEQTDAAGNVTEWAIEDDRPIERNGPDGLVTSYQHDDDGNLLGWETPTGVCYTLERDAHGRVTALREDDIVLYRYEHDAEHNVVRETDARKGTTTRAFDALGRPAEEVDAAGATWRAAYDAVGRVVELSYPDGTKSLLEYDSLGNVTRTTNALGQVTEMEYAGTGVLSRLRDTKGESWRLVYDRDERLIEVLNPSLERYAFEYDAAGRIKRETTFDQRELSYAYDEGGLVRLIDYPDDTFRELQRDVLGNVVKEVTREDQVAFERDDLGRIAQAVIADRTGKRIVRFERDELGRVVAEHQGENVVRYAYDVHDRVLERVLPNGATTRYEYDALGAASAVVQDGQRFDLLRDWAGRETRRKLASGDVVIDRSYDPMGRLAELRFGHGGGSALQNRRAYSYDRLGRVSEINDSRWEKTVYHYDDLGQLLEAKSGKLREVFRYDATGSLRSALSGLEGSGASRSWDTEIGNLLKETEAHRYRYDARGRRIAKTAKTGPLAGGETKYIWDVRDRLTEVQKPNGERIQFTYDPLGRRVSKEVVSPGAKPKLVSFVWDGAVLAADQTNGYERVFVNEPGTFVPMLQAEAGRVYAVVTDHLGMPKELLAPNGQVAWSAAHSAWGTVLETHHGGGEKVESPFRLLGQYFDEETGLGHALFRYFDADVGRWCSPDPLGIVGGSDLFGLEGSPSSVVDPFGLCGQVHPKDNPKFKAPTRRNFRENLRRLTGNIPVDAQAHHVFPQKFAQQFEKAGINIHEPQFGAWWAKSPHQKYAYEYNLKWQQFLATNPDKEFILDFGREISGQYGVAVNF